MWLLIFIIPLFVWLDYHIFRFFFGAIFSSKEDFNDSIRYSFTPDLFSLFKGEYLKDYFAELKLGLFFILCTITVALEIFLIKVVLY